MYWPLSRAYFYGYNYLNRFVFSYRSHWYNVCRSSTGSNHHCCHLRMEPENPFRRKVVTFWDTRSGYYFQRHFRSCIFFHKTFAKFEGICETVFSSRLYLWNVKLFRKMVSMKRFYRKLSPLQYLLALVAVFFLLALSSCPHIIVRYSVRPSISFVFLCVAVHQCSREEFIFGCLLACLWCSIGVHFIVTSKLGWAYFYDNFCCARLSRKIFF